MEKKRADFQSFKSHVKQLTAGVLVRSDGLRRAGQVEYDEFGLVRLVHDDFVQAHGRVHATDVGRLVPEDYDLFVKNINRLRFKEIVAERFKGPTGLDFTCVLLH